jgi:type IV secretory pathway VirB10-like protein
VVLPGRLSFQPAALTMIADVAAGQPGAAAPQSPDRVHLANVGGMPVEIQAIVPGGDTRAFAITAPEACRNLAPSAGCDIDVTFQPPAPGAYKATLTVLNNGLERTTILQISALAAAPPEALQLPDEAAIARRMRDRDRPRELAASGPSDPTDVYSYEIVARRDGAASRQPGQPRDRSGQRPAPGYGSGRTSSLPVNRERIITNDRYIDAVLESSLNSALPGRATAVVERDVFGADGRYVLIPAGSKLVGTYASLKRQGDSRLAMIWSRILRPDGAQIVIDDGAADEQGRQGLSGDIDSRFFARFGSALIVSTIAAAASAGAALANNGTEITGVGSTSSFVVQPQAGQAASLAAAQSLNQNLGNIVNQILKEQANLAPIITIPQGSRFKITPMQDILLVEPDGPNEPARFVPAAQKPAIVPVAGDSTAAQEEAAPAVQVRDTFLGTAGNSTGNSTPPRPAAQPSAPPPGNGIARAAPAAIVSPGSPDANARNP